jgi:hypothetical protein
MNQFDTEFDPFEILQNLQEAYLQMGQALHNQQRLNELNNQRLENLLTIVQNQQKQIDMIWLRQEHLEAVTNK